MDHNRVLKIASAVRQAIERCEPTMRPWPSFPLGACGDTSLILGQVLEDESIPGFMYICGNKRKADGHGATHAWLQNGPWIVDITADQFPDVDQPVIVTSDSAWHSKWELEEPQPGALQAYGNREPHLWRLLMLLKPRLALD
ncbi:hypothetical protein BTM36_19780 [Herbaspirillum sp. VT-16-41]|nr:hypothetical protein BTM36_19780 [Herbaspirillum sp. VT-16-41]